MKINKCPFAHKLVILGLFVILFTLLAPTSGAHAETSSKEVDNTSSTPPLDMRQNPDTGLQYTPSQGIRAATGVQTDQQTDGAPVVKMNGSDFDSSSESTVLIRPYLTADQKSKVPKNSMDTEPWFVINYLDTNGKKPGFMSFSDSNGLGGLDGARNFKPTKNENDNSNKMVQTNSSNGNSTWKLDTASNKNYSGGYLNIAGNVPIYVKIQPDMKALMNLFSGNYGVMVKVQLPPDVDVKAFTNTIDWTQSYFNLKITGLDSNVQKIAKAMNFPMQFDHHVYMDPNSDNTFYLKVKGIPYRIDSADGVLGSTASFHILSPDQDLTDYRNNVTADGTSVLPDNDGNPVTASQGKAWQPDLSNLGWLAELVSPGGAASKIKMLGFSAALINGIQPYYDTGYGILNSTIASLFQNLTSSGFVGQASINFNFDMSKYTGNSGNTGNNSISSETQSALKSLTAGRLFPSAKSDGSFNDSNGNGSLKISLYGSDQLYDPYKALTKSKYTGKPPMGDRYKPLGNDPTTDRKNSTQHDKVTRWWGNIWQRESDSGDPDPTKDKLTYNFDYDPTKLPQLEAKKSLTKWPGDMPMDYAVIQKDQIDKGTAYPVYTNFTSWNDFIVPFDNLFADEKTDRNLVSPNAKAPLTDSINSRRAALDFGKDGLLVNNNPTYNLSDVSTPDTYTFNDVSNRLDDYKEGLTAGVTPKRFTQVYRYFDSSGHVNPTQVKPTDSDAKNIQITAKNPKSTSGKTPDKSAPSGQSDSTPYDVNGTDKVSQIKYTGINTVTGIPLLDNQLNISQDSRPTLDLGLPQFLALTKDKLKDKENGYVYQGTIYDPFADNASKRSGTNPSGQDTFAFLGYGDKDYDAIGAWVFKNIGTANGAIPVATNNGASEVHFKVHLYAQKSSSDTGEVKTGKNGLVSDIYIPINADNSFGMITTRLRRSGLLVGGTTSDSSNTNYSVAGYDPDKADINKNNDVTNESMYSVSDTTPTEKLTVRKRFTSNNGKYEYTTQPVFATNQVIHVKTTITNKGNTEVTDPIVMIPKPGSTAQDTMNTFADITDVKSSAGTASPIQQSDFVGNQFAIYQLKGATLKQGDTVTYTYNYEISDIDKFKTDTLTLTDVIQRSDRSATLGQSNAVTLRKTVAPTILSVPTLDFGQHKVSTDTNFNLTDASKKQAQLMIYNPASYKGNWTLSAQLSPFKLNGTDNDPEITNNFKLNLGQPSLYDADKSGSDEAYNLSDYYTGQTLQQIETYHTSQELTSDNIAQVVYYRDGSIEDQTAPTNLVLNYQPETTSTNSSNSDDSTDGEDTKSTNNVTLRSPNVLKSGKYTATMTYSITSSLE
ncbi:hypothetical protein FHQ08_09515 [Lactobacillus sp. CC-MHH1034]|uniref:hypothetical protein n=1 Tax=Agrilactobacillus fermenti TaxID=2586909 RepID=UPI001E500F36|nr:hypothetical protein [Agrilactobacillus fermenti]MCD2256961.1 hypothetical protein [Agrilactobacillus fermenti]